MEKTITVAGQTLVIKEHLQSGLTERAGEVVGLAVNVLDKKGRLCHMYASRSGLSFWFVKNGVETAGNNYDIVGKRVDQFDAEILEALTIEYMSRPTCRRNTLELAANPSRVKNVSAAVQAKRDRFQAWAARAAEEPKAPIEATVEGTTTTDGADLEAGTFTINGHTTKLEVYPAIKTVGALVHGADGKVRWLVVNRSTVYYNNLKNGVPSGRGYIRGTWKDDGTRIPLKAAEYLQQAHVALFPQDPQPDPEPEKASHYSQEELAEIWADSSEPKAKTVEQKAPRYEVRQYTYGKIPAEYGVWDTDKAEWMRVRIQTDWLVAREAADTMNRIYADGRYPAVFIGAAHNGMLSYVIASTHTEAAETIARQHYNTAHAVARLLSAGGPELVIPVWVRELGKTIGDAYSYGAQIRAGGDTLQPEIKMIPKLTHVKRFRS